MQYRDALSTAASTSLAIVILVASIGGYALISESGTASNQTASTESTTLSTASHYPEYYSWQLEGGYQISIQNLLGNYSQMAFLMTTRGLNYSESANGTFSFEVIGHPMLDGVSTTEVASNSTLLAFSNGVRVVDQSVNIVVWIAVNGTVIQSNQNGSIRTGSDVGNPDSLLTPISLGGPFDLAADILSLNSTMISAVNSSTIDVGKTPIAMTTFEPTKQLAYSLVPFGLGYSVVVEAGLAQGTSFYVPVYLSIFGPPIVNGFRSELAVTTISLISITAA